MFDLTPKGIILNSIKTKLEPYGIEKVIMLFSLENDMYNLMVSNASGKSMKLDITEDEITTIKKLFIKRIEKVWNMKYDIEPKNIIIQIDLRGKMTLEIFITDFADKVHKFNY